MSFLVIKFIQQLFPRFEESSGIASEALPIMLPVAESLEQSKNEDNGFKTEERLRNFQVPEQLEDVTGIVMNR